MGLFDFPRIHFSGNIDDINGFWYIEIEPINTIELLRTWCMNSLGLDGAAPDAAYIPYYLAADHDLAADQGAPIYGFCPGYWNMYGDMSVLMSGVTVTGVQTFDGVAVNTWTNASENLPPNVKPFLQASFDFDSSPGNGITTACMVETISSQSVFANIFCNEVNLYNSRNGNEILFQGTHFRFAALIYGAWRVVNWMPPMAGSGRFCSAIPLAEIPEAEQGPFIQFFQTKIGFLYGGIKSQSPTSSAIYPTSVK